MNNFKICFQEPQQIIFQATGNIYSTLREATAGTLNPMQNHLLKHFSASQYTMAGAKNIEMPNTAPSLVGKSNK